jgi:hypothetical protein
MRSSLQKPHSTKQTNNLMLMLAIILYIYIILLVLLWGDKFGTP